MLGRGVDATRALQNAERVLDGLPDDITREGDSIFNWPESRFRHAESFVHS